VAPERLDTLAIACVLIWCAGAGLTHVIGIWAGVGGAAIALGFAVLFLAWPTLAPLLRTSGPLLAWGAAAAIVMIAGTNGLYPVLSGGSAAFARDVHGLYGLFRAADPLWVPHALLPFMIVSEELIWRGVVQEALGRRLAPSLTVLLASAAYAAAHAPVGSLLLTALALACGFYWSAIRARTGSLIPSLISHLVWDYLVFVLRPLG
jgi:membrane protease YdiL (CAAX protease family)